MAFFLFALRRRKKTFFCFEAAKKAVEVKFKHVIGSSFFGMHLLKSLFDKYLERDFFRRAFKGAFLPLIWQSNLERVTGEEAKERERRRPREKEGRKGSSFFLSYG